MLSVSEPRNPDLQGSIDVLWPTRVAGWVRHKSDPTRRLTVIIHYDGNQLEVEAASPRADLKAAGFGDGRYSFDVAIAAADVNSIAVQVKDAVFEIPVGEGARQASELRDTQISPANFKTIAAEDPSVFDYIRFDPNFDCNLHCVYCHNPRSKEVIDIEEFRTFLQTKVLSVRNLQIGCIMEPTLDRRLVDFMLMIADSPARPNRDFQLQTNGILLHRHDHSKFNAAGLKTLSVSLDAAEPTTQKLLRNGTSLDKVVRNILGFRQSCPDITVQFITTVTSANIDKLNGVIEMGLRNGIKKFVFREVFYHPENQIVDHEKMKLLILRAGQFVAKKDELIAEFGADADMSFFDERSLEISLEKMIRDSRFQ